MANEATITELFGNPEGQGISYLCDPSTAIAKGAILKLSGGRTIAASDGTNQIFAGIAAFDKESTDSKTRMTAYTKGIFGLTVSGTVTLGDNVKISGANLIVRASTESDLSGGRVVGRVIGGNLTDATIAQVAVGVY